MANTTGIGWRIERNVHPSETGTWASWSWSQIITAIQTEKLTPNRIEQFIYNAQNQLLFGVNGIGQVTGYQYQPGEEVKCTLHYAQLVLVSTNYSAVVKAVEQLSDKNVLNHFVKNEYNAMGKIIATTNADKHINRFFYDELGRKRFHINSSGGIEEWQYTQFGKISVTRKYTQSINPKLLTNQTTLTELIKLINDNNIADPKQDERTWNFYDQDNRLSIVIDNTGLVKQTVYDNGLQEQETMTYTNRADTELVANWNYQQAADWVLDHSQENNAKTIFIRDGAGRVRFTINPNRYITETVRDADGNVMIETQYATPISDLQTLLNLNWQQVASHLTKNDKKDRITYKIYDTFGRVNFAIDARGGVTCYQYNKQGDVTEQCEFAKNITPPANYAEIPTSVQEQIAKLLPDNPKNRIQQFDYDADHHKVMEKDARGNITYFYYDDNGNKRFEVLADGGMIEWLYNIFGKIQAKREYTNPLPLTGIDQQTPLSIIIDKAKALQDDQDSQERSYYDLSGDLIYTVKSHGVDKDSGELKVNVVKFAFDAAGHKTSEQAFADFLLTKGLSQLTQLAIDNWVTSQQDNINNRPTYSIYDGAGQKRFSINGQGIVTETRYDAAGREIMGITYDNPLADPASVAKLPPDQVVSSILEPQLHSVKFTVYNSAGKIHFKVKSDGNVIRYDRDAVGNKLQKTRFKKRIDVTLGYDALVSKLKSYIPNRASQDNSIKNYTYNFANERIVVVDPLLNLETFDHDKCGNVISHKQKNTAVWSYQYSRFNQLELITQPAVEKENITYDAGKKKLVCSESPVKVAKQTKIEYDLNGNKASVIDGYGRAEKREVSFDYTVRNKLQETRHPGVSIEDAKKPASFTELPTQAVSVDNQVVFNAKGLKIVVVADQAIIEELDDKTLDPGETVFLVYDANKKLSFYINQQGAVTQLQRNAFGQVESKARYYNSISIKPEYFTQGISYSTVSQELKPSTDQDRVVSFLFDRAGQKTQVIHGKVFYCLGSNLGDTLAAEGNIQPQESYLRDANGAKIGTQKPWQYATKDQPAIIVTERTWLDRNGKEIAKIFPVQRLNESPQYKVITYQYDGFGNQIGETQYTEALKVDEPITVNTSFEQLQTWLQPLYDNDKYIHYSYQYDLNGQLFEKSPGSQNIQTLDEEGQPEISTVLKLLKEKYTYTAMGKKQSYTDRKGNTEYYYYDLLDNQIGIAKVPRQQILLDGNKAIKETIIPVVYYGYNLFNEQVREIKFINPVTEVDPNIRPAVKPNPAHDQQTLNLRDSRGSKMITQDPCENIKIYTFSSGKKVLREFGPLTTHEAEGQSSKYTVTVKANLNIYEEQLTLDGMHRVETLSLKENNKEKYFKRNGYNIFSEVDREGNHEDFYLFRGFDRIGRLIKVNNNGVTKFFLRDGSGKISVKVTSPTRVLDAMTVADSQKIAEQMHGDLTNYTIWQNVRDARGRSTYQINPAYHQAKDELRNIPVVMDVSDYSGFDGKLNISWSADYQNWVRPHSITLYPVGKPDQDKSYPIQRVIVDEKLRYGLAVDDFVSDHYQYTIQYQLYDIESRKYVNEDALSTSGQLQIITDQQVSSERVVVQVTEGDQLLLSGNVSGLEWIQLLQGNDPVGQRIPVKPAKQTGYYTADLSKVATAEYTLKPVFSDGREVVDSVPFTVFTKTAPTKPVAREFIASATVKTLENWGQVIWTVKEPLILKKATIKIQCDYLSGEDHYQHEDTIAYGTDKGEHKDKFGHVLIANTIFEHDVSKLVNLTLSLEIAPGEFLPIYQTQTPQKSADTSQDVIQTFDFTTQELCYVYPFSVPASKPPEVTYLDTNSARRQKTLNLQSVGLTKQGVIFNTATMLPGYYPFHVGKQRAAFFKGQGGLIYPSQSIADKTLQQVIWPMSAFVQDVFDHVTEHTTPDFHTTKQKYNWQGALAQTITPPVTAYDRQGTPSVSPLRTQHGYDANGEYIGSIGPNQLTTIGIDVDNAGHQRTTILASGVKARQNSFNALSQIEFFLRASWEKTKKSQWFQVSNRKNKVTTVISPTGDTWKTGYNERSQRSSTTNPRGSSWYMNWSVNNDITADILPQGQTTAYLWDINHQLLKKKLPDGLNLYTEFKRDYFGTASEYWDLNRAYYKMMHNGLNQLDSRICYSIGDQPTGHGADLLVKELYNNDGMNYYSSEAVPAPLQHLVRKYDGIRLIREDDHSKDHVATILYGQNRSGYSTDVEYRVINPVLQSGELIRELHTTLDALYRSVVVYDTVFTLTRGYDLFSNTRFDEAHLLIDDNGNPQLKRLHQSWNDFNEDNNIIKQDCVLDSGMILPKPGKGYLYGYEFGLRTSQSIDSTAAHSTSITSILYYDDSDRIHRQVISGAGIISQYNLWNYDKGMFANMSYYDERTDGGFQAGSSDYKFYPNAQIESVNNSTSYTHSLLQEASKHNSTMLSQYTMDEYGIVTNLFTHYQAGKAYVKDRLTYSHILFDDIIPFTLSGTREDNAGTGDFSVTTEFKDANGNTSAKTGASSARDQTENGPSANVVLINTPGGLILQKRSISGHNKTKSFLDKIIYSLFEESAEWDELSPFYQANGNVVATYYGQLSPNRLQEGKFFSNYLTQMVTDFGGRSAHAGFGESDLRFRHNVDPFSRSYPSPQPPVYITQEKAQNLLDFAKRFEGNAHFASALERVNGFAQNIGLNRGQILQLPQNWYPSQETADTHVPYEQFVEKIIGAMYPHMDTKKPSFWDELLKIIIFVVIMIVASFSSGGNVLLAAALGAGLDIVAQEIEKKLGIEKKFSWLEVIQTAFASGAARLPGTKTIEEAMIRAGKIDIAEQLLELVTGRIKEINFLEILNSVISAGVGVQLSRAFSDSSSKILRELVTSTETAFINEMVDSILTNEPFSVMSFVLQALGDTVGEVIGDEIVDEMIKAEVAQRMAYIRNEQLYGSLSQQALLQDLTYLEEVEMAYGRFLGEALQAHIKDLEASLLASDSHQQPLPLISSVNLSSKYIAKQVNANTIKHRVVHYYHTHQHHIRKAANDAHMQAQTLPAKHASDGMKLSMEIYREWRAGRQYEIIARKQLMLEMAHSNAHPNLDTNIYSSTITSKSLSFKQAVEAMWNDDLPATANLHNIMHHALVGVVKHLGIPVNKIMHTIDKMHGVNWYDVLKGWEGGEENALIKNERGMLGKAGVKFFSGRSSQFVPTNPSEQLGEEMHSTVSGVIGFFGRTKGGDDVDLYRAVEAEKMVTPTFSEDYGVALFGKDNLRYYVPDKIGGIPNLGAKGRPFFIMPGSDAAKIDSVVRAATETGFSPSTFKAWKEGGDIYGIALPAEGLEIRVPTKTDAMGWRHFLEGGYTAINVEGTNSFIVNTTREFVIPGGNPMPKGSVLFRLDDNGGWVPIWRY